MLERFLRLIGLDIRDMTKAMDARLTELEAKAGIDRALDALTKGKGE
ncbi:hypothetical protein [Qipengyuania sp.]